ncbi:response regulator receiver protein [Thauera sp. 28]|uniref:TIR domain-containing protein n=1 Tax=Thauera sp. 28 TaxID=303682 RepID=UPI0002CE37DF|nr:TIR domain-containing protein [Thauera sp. 28]ENO91039.1 response regulator receiver protein [Thauera sp. 28]
MEPVDLFYSYAHEDEKLRDELDGHLALLRRKGVIRPWHDRGIVPGQKWDEAIDTQLTHADLILLLVSMDFLNSDYIWGKELATAVARAERGDASVVPILLRAVDIEDAPFAHLQGLPTDLRPVTSWPNRDEAWTDVAKGIRRTVEKIQQRWASAPPPSPAPSAPRSSDFGTATATAPAPEADFKVLGTRLGARAKKDARVADKSPDPLLRRMIAGFANELSVAARMRGVADIGSDEAEGTALALIDMPDQKRVLWVDDKPEGNRHEVAALAKLQIETVAAHSTEEALARLDADDEGFDLVISDWSRPEALEGMPSAGLKLLRALALRPRRPPVIFYHGEFDDTRRAARRDTLLRAGAFGEAVLPGELLALVRTALQAA